MTQNLLNMLKWSQSVNKISARYIFSILYEYSENTYCLFHQQGPIGVKMAKLAINKGSEVSSEK